MLKLLFWNVGRRPSLHVLAQLVQEHSPDVVILAESPAPEVEVVEVINRAGARLYNLTLNLSTRLQFFVGLSPDGFLSVIDDIGVAARRLIPPIGAEILVVAVHLGSKLHLSDADQAQLSTRLREVICDAERLVEHDRTVLIGDFNMNPFEMGIVSSEGAHGAVSRAIAAQRARTVQGRSRRFFYNPMWSLLGDDTPGPPGTYYYRVAKPFSLDWHMFDQCLLRPALAQNFEIGDVSVLTTAAGMRLLTDAGVPDRRVSDHLPVLLNVRSEESVNVGESVG